MSEGNTQKEEANELVTTPVAVIDEVQEMMKRLKIRPVSC